MLNTSYFCTFCSFFQVDMMFTCNNYLLCLPTARVATLCINGVECYRLRLMKALELNQWTACSHRQLGQLSYYPLECLTKNRLYQPYLFFRMIIWKSLFARNAPFSRRRSHVVTITYLELNVRNHPFFKNCNMCNDSICTVMQTISFQKLAPDVDVNILQSSKFAVVARDSLNFLQDVHSWKWSWACGKRLMIVGLGVGQSQMSANCINYART